MSAAALKALAGVLREVPEPAPLCGIYFLVRRGQIVYVGQSTNVVMRIATHRTFKGSNTQRRVEFERAYWVPVPADQLDAYEGAFIRRLKPPCNRNAPKGNLDAFVIETFGLPEVSDARSRTFARGRSRSYGGAA